MTDQEIICTFMEPKSPEARRWWRLVLKDGRLRINNPVEPIDLDLDALWEVEERLTTWALRDEYVNQLDKLLVETAPHEYKYVHAKAEQKIKALAAVLRPIAGVL